ncbi:hypothetical protein [Novosphingobium sp. HII-3]|uniref:hypothetical protein n=1 Tax=Novosphingobium sp. HII-3 TaxID=2075565 RepID=UPI000CDAF21C|nr:hypothetical protein [Novosphingobium sp. HII-3]
MTNQRTSYDITTDLDLAFLKELPKDDLLELTRLMARAAERSYRRGFQQGATIARGEPAALPLDLHEWRYGTTTDISPWADAPRAETAVSRLHGENSRLRALGLPTSTLTDQFEIFVWPPKE